MSLELWTEIATIGTFVVLGAGTAAALIQLTQLRSSNQLQALMDLGQELQRMASHLGFVYHELPRKMEDPAFRREVGVKVDAELHPELLVALHLDRFGLLVKMNLMSADENCRTPIRTLNSSQCERGSGWTTFQMGRTRHPNRELQLTDRWAGDERP